MLTFHAVWTVLAVEGISSSQLQLDLPAILVFTAVVISWMIVGDPPVFIRIGMIGGLLLLVPGYALTILLFPRSSDSPRNEHRMWPSRTVDGLERLALSIGLSVALLPIMGVLIAASPWGITQRTVLLGMGGAILLISVGGFFNRMRLDPPFRYQPTFGTLFAGDRASVAVSVTLLFTALIAVGILGYAIAAPQAGEQTSDIYVLSPGDDDDSFVAAGYPETVEQHESVPVEVGVENHEHETVDYTVVVVLEELDEDGSVADSRELALEEVTLDHGDTRTIGLDLTPTMAGEDLRVSFLLYQGDPHIFLDQRTAYQHVHIWLDVVE